MSTLRSLLLYFMLLDVVSSTLIKYDVEEEQPVGHQVGVVTEEASFKSKYGGEIPSILR